jgi:hypothetical protein
MNKTSINILSSEIFISFLRKMSTFSPPRRVKDPIKLALAAVIIYAIAFWQGWEKPYWASVSAASVFLLSDGLTIHRGLVRTASAIAGGFIALAVIAMFPQQRWGYLAVSCVVLFLMGYGMTGLKEPYSFCVAAITYCVVLAVTQSIDRFRPCLRDRDAADHPDLDGISGHDHCDRLRLAKADHR